MSCAIVVCAFFVINFLLCVMTVACIDIRSLLSCFVELYNYDSERDVDLQLVLVTESWLGQNKIKYT